MYVYVFQEDGPTVMVTLPNDANLKDLKREIEAKLMISPERQYLYNKTTPLTSFTELSAQGIFNGHHIRLKIQLEDAIKVFLCWLDGDTITLFVKPSDTGADLIAKVQEKTGFWADDLQIYVWQNMILENEDEMCDFPIEPYHAFRIKGELSLMRKVTIKCTDHESFFVSVNASDTVATLKAEINQKISLPPHCQRLYHSERLLPDSDTLAKVGLMNGDTVLLKIVASVPK